MSPGGAPRRGEAAGAGRVEGHKARGGRPAGVQKQTVAELEAALAELRGARVTAKQARWRSAPRPGQPPGLSPSRVLSCTLGGRHGVGSAAPAGYPSLALTKQPLA